MRKLLVVLLLSVGMLVACEEEVLVADYTIEEFEEALNNNVIVNGKTVELVIEDIAPNSKLGHNLQAGEHLNFVSIENPGYEIGDTVIVTIVDVGNIFGSYIIAYE